MKQEISWKEISDRSGIPLSELESAEKGSVSQTQRRVGEFDWELLHRAAFLNRPTDVALTFVDYLSIKNREAYRFDQLETATIQFIERVEVVSHASVSLISTRFSARLIDRRRW